jgi:hypothetical protein
MGWSCLNCLLDMVVLKHGGNPADGPEERERGVRPEFRQYGAKSSTYNPMSS